MTAGPQISVLIANADAAEVKQITIGIRSVFPGCRVEAIYAGDELMEWVARHEWQIVFLDEPLLQSGWLSVIPEVRKRLPRAAIILETDRNEIAVAMQAIRAGADHCFYKKSPTFATEFPAAAKVLVEKREQPPALLDRSNDPYARLSEEMTEIVYELDSEGRFVNVGPGVTRLLGYTPEELIGMHFSKVVPEEERQLAEHRLNERRTGDRATRNLELRLKPKGTEAAEDVIEVELTAMGRYNQQRQILGTVGVIRDIRGRKRAIQEREMQLRQQFREREEQLGKEFHEWERQIEDALRRREQELQSEFQRRESELAQEHQRLTAEMQHELERRQELQRREEELKLELRRREEQLTEEHHRLKSEMQVELERRQELQRREELLREELQKREDRFKQEQTHLELELERQYKEREAQLRQEYQQQVERLSEERHRLEREIEQKLEQEKEQLRQDAERQETKLHLERQRLEAELNQVLEQPYRPDSSGTVLIVESQETVLGLTRTLLQQHGYTVLSAATANEATAICRAYKFPIHLLLTDVGKPGNVTLEMAGRFTELRPEMKVLFLSGCVTDAKHQLDMLNRGIAFLPKPFSPDMLIRKIADTIDVTDPANPPATGTLRLSALP
ncbi:response regulator [Candidatus Nitrospira bockiana]